MIINDVQFGSDLPEIINELRAQLAINQIPLLQGKVVETPTNVQVCCPFHKGGQERKPSMGIRKSDGLCHCFTCGEVVPLQRFVSFCFGREEDLLGAFGWNWLLKNFVSISVEEREGVDLDFQRSYGVANRTSSISNCELVSEQELDSYRYIHPYMYKRKLTDEIIELFDIGYDTNSKCITFPVRDINGNCLFVARRSVITKFFNYPQGAEKPVYGLYELQKLAQDKLRECNVKDLSRWQVDEIIICESMLDALTCWVYGAYAVALNGLGNELQFKQLNQMPCRKFILATDMDDAGKKARDRIRKNLKGKLITEYIWDVHVAKDINDMSKEMFDNLEEVF